MKRLLLPYAFRGIKFELAQLLLSGKIVDQTKCAQSLGQGLPKQFSHIYSEVLQAIAEKDRDYLKSIMEPRLFERTIKGIEEIEEKKMKICYLESPQEQLEEGQKQDWEESELSPATSSTQAFKIKIVQDQFYTEADMKIYLEAYGVFGARIIRDENTHKVFELRGRFAPRSYFINLSNPMSLYYDQILRLNVYFTTTRRLFITDEDGDLVHGEDSTKQEMGHVWCFETYSPNFDWVLTDMDTVLEGNPYYAPRKK